MQKLRFLLLFALTTLVGVIVFSGCRGSVERVYDDSQLLADSGAPLEGGANDGGKKEEGGSNPPVEAGATAAARLRGTVIGVLGTGLVLQNKGADDLSIETSGAFEFATPVPPNLEYEVSVLSQPTGPSQTCIVTNGKGIANGVDVTNIEVTCNNETYAIGGVVVGLTQPGLVLQNNGGNDLTIAPGSTSFGFLQKVPSGGPFNVTVKSSPAGQTCNVSGATGTIVAAAVDSVVVNCAANTYTLGGTATGLAGSVVIRNGGTNRTISANGTWAFPVPIASGTGYAVTVQTQPRFPPVSQTCTITGGTGSIGSANVTNVAIACTTNRFSVGGNVTGLVAGGSLVLKINGGFDRTITANGPFSFPNIASGTGYTITVGTQPVGQQCNLTNRGVGTVGNDNITDVAVTCAQGVVFSENFDSVTRPALPAGWTATALAGDPADNFRTSMGESDTGLSLHADNEPYVTDFVVTSPPINITTTTAQLSFWLLYETEWEWDGAALEISIAGGEFVDILAAGGSFISGGYNATMSVDSLAGLKGRAVWMGDWTEVNSVVRLPAAAAGKSIVLRWRISSDDGAGGSGIYVDTILVRN